MGQKIQESLANTKVSVRQQWVYEGSCEEIYGKSTQGTRNIMLKSTFTCLQCCRWQYKYIFIAYVVVVECIHWDNDKLLLLFVALQNEKIMPS